MTDNIYMLVMYGDEDEFTVSLWSSNELAAFHGERWAEEYGSRYNIIDTYVDQFKEQLDG